MRDARNWLDKNRLAENDEFEAQQKKLEEVPADMMTSRQVPAAQIMQKTCENPQVQSMDMVVNMPVPAPHQVPTVHRVETAVGGPKVQFNNEVMDVLVFKLRRVSTAMQTARKTDQTVEVARAIPHERTTETRKRKSFGAGARPTVRDEW